MIYQFKENYRNIKDDELIEDVLRVSKQINLDTLTMAQYDKYGKYSSSTLCKRFGNWQTVLKKAELSVGKNQKFKVSSKEIIDDIILVAKKLDVNSITTSQYLAYGKYTLKPIVKNFGTWEKALKKAKLEPTGFKSKVTDIELYEDIENMWIQKGAQPTTTDVRNGLSQYALNTFARKFGSWNNAIKSFISYVNSEDSLTSYDTETKVLDNKKINNYKKRKTNRDINLRLRFKILQRDNFKCCICGASPAKDSSVILHVDHIIPWAKGGETTEENLQTLCSKCNLGKSDL